jgi:hypothetical protein
MNAFDPNTQFFMRWIRGDGAICDQGKMSMVDFADSGTYNWDEYPSYQQQVFSAMVYPVVCKSSDPFGRTVTVQVSRNIAGPTVYLGPPVVRPGACSWFITQ